MNSRKLMYPKGKSNEMRTPSYGVWPLIEFIRGKKTIWLPFDLPTSQYAIVLKAAGHKVICSHIKTGQDFYKWQPKQHWDIMISNPPFEGKRLIFERAISFGRPFALLMTMTWLNDSAVKQLFNYAKTGKDLQLLMFEQRIKFMNVKGKVEKKITFSSGYYCWNFLPKQIIMKDLKEYGYEI